MEAVISAIMLITLNAGMITNSYEGNGINLKDTGAMYGGYAQYIAIDRFQANVFGYYAPDVNYSAVFGIHANADAYFLNGAWGSLVAGIDYEEISIDMDAGSHVSGLENFELVNDVRFLMFRSGPRFKFRPSERISLTIFPYAAATYERVDGTVTVNPMGPPAFTPETKSDFSDTEYFLSWGVNCSLRAFHFTEFTVKYLGREKKDERLNSWTAQVNIYLPWDMAASYQFKRMDLESGYDQYHLFGIGAVF